ncbi:MCE family protein [Nocardioides carbamazepini]|uniref:MCE family protein n=1 Tax=Nocardioides carbamazepini TaxID=2854259 RepID=UPI00214A11C3|nr:MCE family protein [Nocardioides carbamazepini]MCR1781378.1 MCE family protein [Nocardioides carbamazepini]
MATSPVRLKERADLVRLVIFLVVAALVTFWVAAVTSEYRSGGATTYRAAFDDVSGLQEGDQVRAAGVRVGQVTDIDVRPDSTVVVSFEVDDSLVLDDGTTATIEYRNLIGDRIVQMASEGAGTGTKLAAGGMIPIANTASALDLDTLLNGFKPLFAGLNPTQVNELSQQLVQVLQGQESAVETLTTRVGSFTSAIAQREQLITQVIGNLNEVLETVDGRRDEVGQLIDALDVVLTRFDEQDTEILIAAEKIDQFAREASALVGRARGDLTPDLRALTEAARGLNLEKEELVAVLRQLPRHYRKLQNAGSYGNFFNFFLCGVRLQTDAAAGVPVLTPWINSDAERCQR